MKRNMKLKRKPEVRLAVVLAALCIWNEGLATGQTTQNSILVGSVSTTEASFLTNPPSPTRNNFAGAAGFQFQVSQPITVTSLGRYYPAAGSSHTVDLWSNSNSGTLLVSAVIPAQTTLEQPSFIYTTISPVTLNPGTVYAIAINESAGGDFWVDDWIPGTAGHGVLNGIMTNVVAAYALTKSTYPLYTSTVGGVYDTPAMIFTTNVPLLGSGASTTNIVSQATGPTTIVTASNPSTPMMYFMRPSSGSSPSIWPVGSYIGPNGDFESNAWITLAGNASITVPYPMPAMMSIAPDVAAGIIFEANGTSPGFYAYGVLDLYGNFRFSQQYDGSHCWGFGVNTKQSNDVCLTRPAAGALEVNSGTIGKYAGTKFAAGGNVLDNNGVTLVGVSQPVCSASLAGKLWYSGHTEGVKDSAAICAADATNTFAWRTLY
jgi:hypothetical protein